MRIKAESLNLKIKGPLFDDCGIFADSSENFTCMRSLLQQKIGRRYKDVVEHPIF
jgi:hypothetical protein